MKIQCGLCGEVIIVADGLADGQHVRCPYCGEVTEFRKPSRIELPTASEARRGAVPSEARKPLRVIRKNAEQASSQALHEHQMASRRLRMAEEHVEFYERMKDVEHRRKIREQITGLLTLIVVVLCAVGIYWYVGYRKDQRHHAELAFAAEGDHSEAERAEEDRKQRVFREKAGESQKRAEETGLKRAAEGKSEQKVREHEEALDSFRAFLSREKDVVEGTLKETTVAFDEVLRDQKKLSEALIRLEAENGKRSKNAETNGWIRFDKAEMVMMILKDKDMNDLAIKYLGEDLSALRTECRGKIKSALAMQSATAKMLAENRARYRKQLEGIEEEVDRKASKAQEITMQANKDLEARLMEIEKARDKKDLQLKRLKAIDRKTQWIVNEERAVQEEIHKLEKEISRVKEIVAVSRGNVAHIAATAAETLARRKGDAALSSRQDDDNTVHSEMAHVRTIFNLATEYENRSLDKICASMRSRKDILSMRATDAQRKLDFVLQSSANADLMQPEELENLRKRIADRIGEKVLDKLQ